MDEQIAVTLGEDAEVRQFFWLFAQDENVALFVNEVCAFLGWQEADTIQLLSSLEQQELVMVRRGVVALTPRGKRIREELITRRKL